MYGCFGRRWGGAGAGQQMQARGGMHITAGFWSGNVLCLELHAPEAGEREEEAIGDDLRKLVGYRLRSPFLHFHP